MKLKTISILFSLIAISFMGCKKNPREIVLKSAVELSEINSIEYNNLVIQKKSEDSVEKSRTAHCYFDFTNDTPIMKASYHIKTDSIEVIYTGDKNILVNNHYKYHVRDESPDKFS